MTNQPSPSEGLAEEEPFRTYYFSDPSRRSVLRPSLTVAPDWGDKIPNTRGDRITPDAVSALMKDQGLEYLARLSVNMARNLQLMKETKHWADTRMGRSAIAVQTLRKAIPTLVPEATKIAKHVADALADEDCPERQRRTELMKALAEFVRSSQQIMRLTRPVSFGKSTAHWHDDANFLAVELIEEARCVNETVALSKPDSAGVKLIAELLNLALVNHSGVDAIAKELNRRRKSEPFLKV